MKKGRIAEQGNHEQLVSMNGIYAKLNAADEAAAKKDAEKQAKQEQEAIDPDLIAQINPDLISATKSQAAGRRDSRRMSKAVASINIADTKEVDPVAKKMMIQAQLQLKAENNHLNEDLDDLINP